ncbi:MAG: 3-oxo-5alpha-steroid 4-dehydrogenase [Parasphingorhabdus sp.]|uniref:FAD-binding protein n=1 Tax=Parasphingorhabdus sp. TaxID=2709688 RepID=UPI0039E66260
MQLPGDQRDTGTSRSGNLQPGDPEWHSRVQSPLRLSAEDEPVWLDEADVVIIGLGGAGVCAAIEALDAGCSVIAIDRFSGGGATRMSGGVVYAGGGTSMQRDANVEDDPGNMRRYLKLEVENAVSDATLDRFCETSPGLIDWLERQGVRFGSSLAPEKTSYPADGHYLYFSGNEAQALYAKHAHPAQRGHRVVGKGLTGKNLFDTLRATAVRKGLRIYSYAEVNRLVVSESGTVEGVIFERVDPASRAARRIDMLQRSFARSTTLLFPKLGEKLKQRAAAAAHGNSVAGAIAAKKGVILAAGGFIQNREMVRHYAPKYSGATPLGSMGCDGSGIRLGQSVGAVVDRMERISAWRQFLPPKALAQGIVVDGQGRRLIAEDSYGGTTGYMIAEKAAGRAFIIIDRALYWQVIRQAMPGRGKLFRIQGAPALMALLLSSHRGRTLAELARKCGMDPRLLENSVAHYNDGSADAEGDMFRKDPAYTATLDHPPFHAIDISIGNRRYLCPTISLGGIVVDEATGQALGASGLPIPRLYAAGRNAIGISSNHYISGLSLADCIFSGRTAGKTASN